MKNFSSFIFAFFICLSAQAVIYPQLDAVINKLYDNYEVPESTNGRTLNFAKKPAGWFLQWQDQTKYPVVVVEEELFWSAGKQKFQELKKIEKGKTIKTDNEKMNLVFYGDRYYYSRIPYFGYADWGKDVMHDFGNRPNLDDTMLEGLGRAYSDCATGFSYYDHTKKELSEKMKLDSFVKYSRLDIATFDKLRKQNPQYQMLAGNSQIKYADNIMSFFEVLQLSGNESMAMDYFKEPLFDPVILGFSKYSLAECAPNALLFTNGDNDTYPLEYLQFIKGFRTDVTIINMSLLNTYATIEQISKGKRKAMPVKFSYPLERYAEDASSYFYEENADPFDMSFEKFISKSYKQTQADGNSYYNYPQCTIEFSANKNFFPEFPEATSGISPRIKINKAHLLRSDFAQLDIILSNLDNRPIYYVHTAGKLGLDIDNYLFSEGMIKRFIPFRMQNGNTDLIGMYNYISDACYANLLGIDMKADSVKDEVTDRNFVTNFRIQYVLLAGNFAGEESGKAIRLLDHCDSLFPATVWDYEPVWAYGVDAYYKSGKEAKADLIALKLIRSFDEKLKKKTGGPDQTEKAQMIQAVQMIKANTITYKREAVQKWAEDFLARHPTK